MNFYKILNPLIYKLDPEKAHNLAIKFLKFLPNSATIFAINNDYQNLHNEVCGIDFTNPIGLAAGFDKNAEVAKTLTKFGFGFIEIGTVTKQPQIGNKKPRLFRLAEDGAIINRLGFNNYGADFFAKNLTDISSSIVLGVNLGKNESTNDALADYLFLLNKFYQRASYITVNISSPNTKNLRDLQKGDQLDGLLEGVMNRKQDLVTHHKKNTPILLKIAPDLTLEEQEIISQIALKHQVDGLIVSNTTISRNQNLKSKNAVEIGGLSGKPLLEISNQVLRNFYRLTNGKIPLIGVGGISSAADAYQKIKYGASLVQIYSALIYQGFGLVEKIKKELSEMLEKDGFKNISEAIGIDCQ